MVTWLIRNIKTFNNEQSDGQTDFKTNYVILVKNYNIIYRLLIVLGLNIM